MSKSFLKIMLPSITFLGTAYFFVRIVNKLFDLAMSSESDKTKVFNAPHNFVDIDKFSKHSKKYEEGELSNKDLYIESSVDKLKLHAKVFYNQKKSDKWVIACHGYGGIDSNAKIIVHEFFKMGFNVLSPELRGFGETAGKYIGWGWQDRKDVVSWVKAILKINKDAKVVLYGVSMGAAAVMATCGEELPENVKLAIEDSGYSSLWEEFLHQYKLTYRFPPFPILNLASIISKLKASFSFKEADMAKQVAKSKIPIMFIHGEKDLLVPTHMVHKVYDAANVPKKKLLIKGAGHVDGLADEEGLYWNSIKNFITKHL